MRKERWIHAGLAALLTAATLCGCSSSSAGSSQASKTESTTESAAKSTASAENSKTEAVGFVQVTDTANGWNFIDPETDQFEVRPLWKMTASHRAFINPPAAKR